MIPVGKGDTMSTATMTAPSSALLGDAYADLAAELRALAAKVTTPGGLRRPAPVVAVPTAAPETVPDAPSRPWVQRVVFTVADLFGTFVVLPILVFHVAMRLFPPVR
jgi:hypothetical protein